MNATNLNLKQSARMSFVMGLLLPIAETIRRSNQLLDLSEFFSWFDDYILGGIMVWSAYLVFKQAKNAIAYLIASWGIATGAVALSFLAQFNYYKSTAGDPGIFSTTIVAVVKGLILLYILIGLIKAIKANSQQVAR